MKNDDRLKINSPLLDPADDAVWHEWVQLHSERGGDYRERIELIYDVKKRKSIRARALLIALMPFDGERWSPIEFPSKTHSAGHRSDLVFVKLADKELIGFAAKIVGECLSRRQDFCFTALELLPLLSDREADILFARYPLNDLEPYGNMDFCSGYNPFRYLLCAENVDDKWKRKADDVMRSLVTAEICGHAKPRKEHEFAPKCYARAVTFHFFCWNYNKRPCYGLDFLADQISFLLDYDVTRPYVRDVFESIIPLMSGFEYTRLRYRVARDVLVDSDTAGAYSHNVCAIRLALAEFGPFDEQLRIFSERLLAEFEESNLKREQETTRQKKLASCVDERMNITN